MCTAREHYKGVCEDSRKQLEHLFNGDFTQPPAQLPPCCHDVVLHLSFDFAQQVNHQHTCIIMHPLGSLSVKSNATWAYIFSHTTEVRNLWHLLRGNTTATKLSNWWVNTVVSLLHNFLTTCAVHPTDLVLHADNCVGQNKNNTMIQVSNTIYTVSFTAVFY